MMMHMMYGVDFCSGFIFALFIYNVLGSIKM